MAPAPALIPSMSPGLFSVLKRREQLKCTCPPIKPKDRRLSTELKKYKVRLDAYKSILTETRHNKELMIYGTFHRVILGPFPEDKAKRKYPKAVHKSPRA